jgi:hypothetical protein
VLDGRLEAILASCESKSPMWSEYDKLGTYFFDRYGFPTLDFWITKWATVMTGELARQEGLFLQNFDEDDGTCTAAWSKL